ncbi:E3 ubiquitin-protein ligase Midline-1-like [Mizuhopecten yessoensis]|uniref:E3 ubiquitin-protein ligase Midline-1-like n=1 Tax=Mizuhopecten yessoensis TaxID=6573 RepID=UPI000B4588B7|nr:E3 ubiquitin-protein ligase Midline-1-like [Mizuhopecten yessoensis]
MAEGGASPDPPSGDSTTPYLVDFDLIECPICLEQLRRPKCLPCFHSFCEECMSRFIVEEVSRTSDTATFFTCPVCRQITHPVDKSEDTEDWAKQFPTDSHAVEMIQLTNQTTQPLLCKPCQRKGNMTSAKFFCKATQSFLCESCKVDFHDMVHTDCAIIDITGSNKFQVMQTTNAICDKHNRNKIYYCENHEFIGCSQCMNVIGHRDCENVTTIKDYCGKCESRHLFDTNRKALRLGVTDLESLIQDFYLQLQSSADDRDSAHKSIEDLQKQIDQRTAEKKNETTDELISTYKVERDNLKMSIQKCERLKAAMQNTIGSSTRAQQMSDFLNMVLFYQKSKAEIKSCRDLMAELRKSLSTTRIEHEVNFNPSRKDTVLNFGKEVVWKQQRAASVDVKDINQVLSSCQMKEIRKVNMKSLSDTYDCRGYGVVYFPDGRIVVGDHYKNKIKLLDAEDHVVDELNVNGLVWDVCMVDNSTVAVVTEKADGIHVVTVAPSRLIRSSEIKPTLSYCYRITHRNGHFIVSQGCYVYSVSKDGTTQQIHQYDRTVSALAYDPKHGHLFVAYFAETHDRMIVGRLSKSNKYIDLVKVGVVACVTGMDVDLEGNVYVCGSNKVVQMSGNGTNVRELLAAGDGIAALQSISVCGDRVLLTNCSSQKNYIQMFKLC